MGRLLGEVRGGRTKGGGGRGGRKKVVGEKTGGGIIGEVEKGRGRDV